MVKRKKVRYRLVPPEFESMPQNKEDLAKKIADQRERLIKERGLAAQKRSASDDLPIRLTGKQSTFPRSNTMRLVLKNPALSLLVGAGAVVALSLLIRRLGAQRLLRGLNMASPLVMSLLSSQKSCFAPQDSNQDDED